VVGSQHNQYVLQTDLAVGGPKQSFQNLVGLYGDLALLGRIGPGAMANLIIGRKTDGQDIGVLVLSKLLVPRTARPARFQTGCRAAGCGCPCHKELSNR
jgi:hypothetical protein